MSKIRSRSTARPLALRSPTDTISTISRWFTCANEENDFEVELTLNKGRSEPYGHGDGYGHLAVCVGDCPAERARLAGLGLGPGDVKEFHRDGALMARFFFVEDPDGYKIEVLERHGRYI